MAAQRQTSAESLEAIQATLKEKDAELLRLRTAGEKSGHDAKSKQGEIADLSTRIASERELEERYKELAERRAMLGIVKWRASIRQTHLKNKYDALWSS